MNRYFYYHIIYVGMMNVMLFVPHILVRDRFNGALPGMLIAIVVGSGIAIAATSCFEQFPGMGLPDIFNRFLPRAFAVYLNFQTALLWFSAGLLVIYTYTRTTRMFFFPDMNEQLSLLLMLGASIWGASRSTRTVQFVHEIMLLLCAPLLLLIIFKAIFSPWLNWNAIRVAAGYVMTKPSLSSMAAATFLFTGYLSLAVFNRLHPKGFKFRHRWFIPLFGTFFLAVTYFIPIGFHGTVGVMNYVFLWSMTADSMVLEYGFINRVLYIFLLLYMNLSLMFVMNSWHAAIEIAKACWPRRYPPDLDSANVPRINWLLAMLFVALTTIYSLWATEERNLVITELWLMILFCTELVLLTLLIAIVWKEKRRKRRGVSSVAAESRGG